MTLLIHGFQVVCGALADLSVHMSPECTSRQQSSISYTSCLTDAWFTNRVLPSTPSTSIRIPRYLRGGKIAYRSARPHLWSPFTYLLRQVVALRWEVYAPPPDMI